MTEHGIDAFGLRIKKKGTDSDTVYHYNLQGQLIAESVAGSNTVLKEYIYLGDLPIAVLQ